MDLKETELVLYDQMCVAISQCAAVDEAAGIKDKAAKLQAYARVRDNPEAERQFAEIKLRASIRIGELSRELPHGRPGPKPDKNQLDANDCAQFDKENVLQTAGIKLRTAEDYEQLSGGREEQAQKVATTAAEYYFAQQKENEEAPTYGGLRTAIRSALTESFGERPKKATRPKREPDLLVHFLYSADYQAREQSFEPAALAQQVMEPFIDDDLQAARAYLPLLQQFIQHLERRSPHVS